MARSSTLERARAQQPKRCLTLAKSSSACKSAPNIVASGMRGGDFEQNLSDMQAAPTADLAKDHRDIIVGVKTAHYSVQEWARTRRPSAFGDPVQRP